VSVSETDRSLKVDRRALLLDLILELAPSPAVDLQPETVLIGELGYDSLGLFELIVVLEDVMGIPPLDEQEVGSIERIADVERIVLAADRGRG
jgi:acyl carrier protein